MSELNLQEIIENEVKKVLEGALKEHEKKVELKTVSVKEFAKILGCSYQKALRLVHHEKCPCFRIGNKGYRIIISKIDEFLDELIGVEL